MPRRRRSYEAGHQPKLLVVIDDTEECDRAVYYASRRAARIGANVIMLRVIETQDASQQWLGVADIMRAEAHEEADAELAKYATRANGIAGITPERARELFASSDPMTRPAGVASIGAIFAADSPALATAAMLSALDASRTRRR